MSFLLSWLPPIFAAAFFIGGNLYFYFRFFDKPASTIVETDFSELDEDVK